MEKALYKLFSFLNALIIKSVSVVISFIHLSTLLPAQSVPKNVILINVDDIGYGDFGVYGQDLIKTPHIDRMAAEGIRYTNFYSAAPVCGPSRASLLTSRHAGNLLDCGNGQGNLSQNFELWPQKLREAGIRTAQFGKQHGASLSGDRVIDDGPWERGFEEFVGWLNAVDAHQHFIDGETVTPGWPRRDYLFKSNDQGEAVKYVISPDRYVQNEFLDHTIEFIERNRDTSFFLYLPWTIAHAELAIPKPGDPDYRPSLDSNTFTQYLDENGNSIFPEFDYQGDNIYGRPAPFLTRATFAGMISRLDADVGHILEILKSLSLDSNTIVMLTSDNGPHDEGGIDPEQIDGNLISPFNSTGGLRGFKRSLYDGGIRVPMIVWGPGNIPAGNIVEQPLSQIDIGPTLLEHYNLPPIDKVDGKSYVSTWSDDSTIIHDYLYFQYRSQQAVRWKNWKGVRTRNASPQDPVFIYNIKQDPQEINDLSEDPLYEMVLDTIVHLMNNENADSRCPFIPLSGNNTSRMEAFEDFEDTVGSLLAGNNTSEIGWQTPWRLITGDDKTIVEGGISIIDSMNNQIVSSSGNKVLFDHLEAEQNARFIRPLTTPYLDDGKEVWIGFFMETEYTQDQNVFQFILANRSQLGPTGPGGQLVRFGKGFQKNNYGFENGPESSVKSNEPHLFVMKVKYSGDNQNDQILVFIDPSLENTPEDIEANITFTTANLNNGFNAIGIKIEGSAGINGWIDNIRIGNSYEYVIKAGIQVSNITSSYLRQPLEVIIYPNPSDNIIRISSPSPPPYEYQVIDIQGKTCLEGNTADIISVKELHTGKYILRIISGSQSGITEFIKQ